MSDRAADDTGNAEGDEQRVVVIGPDGQPMGSVPASVLAAAAAATGDGRRRRRGRRARHHRPRGAAREGDADRQHDPAAARGGEGGSARRGQPQPAQGDPPGLDQGARGRAGARAGRGAGAALAAVHRGQRPVRGRAADRPGPAGGLARGPVPRHPDRDLRPADGRPGAVRADAAGAAARRGDARRPDPAAPPATRTQHRGPASRAGCTSSGRSAPAGPQPDEDQAEQADDHQRGTGGGQPGQAVRLGVVDLGELRGLRPPAAGCRRPGCRCRGTSRPCRRAWRSRGGAAAAIGRERGAVHR